MQKLLLLVATIAGIALACNPSDFNVYVNGDFNCTNSWIEGRVAAGRDVRVNNMTFGCQIYNPYPERKSCITFGSETCTDHQNAEPTVISGRHSVASNSLVIVGNWYFAAGLSKSGIRMVCDCGFAKVNWSSYIYKAIDNLEAYSQYFAYSYCANGETVFAQKKITFTSQSTSAFFSVSASVLATANSFSLSVPTSAKVVVFNVYGTKVEINGCALNQQFATLKTKIIYNFPDATSVTINNCNLVGAILAPKANVRASGGSINGQIWANSYAPSVGAICSSVKWNNFDGTFPSSTTCQTASSSVPKTTKALTSSTSSSTVRSTTSSSTVAPPSSTTSSSTVAPTTSSSTTSSSTVAPTTSSSTTSSSTVAPTTSSTTSSSTTSSSTVAPTTSSSTTSSSTVAPTTSSSTTSSSTTSSSTTSSSTTSSSTTSSSTTSSTVAPTTSSTTSSSTVAPTTSSSTTSSSTTSSSTVAPTTSSSTTSSSTVDPTTSSSTTVDSSSTTSDVPSSTSDVPSSTTDVPATTETDTTPTSTGPDVPPGPPAAVCGDSIVNGNEQCDGGICCSPDCTFFNSSYICREQNGECDRPEVCTGNSSKCPADTYYDTSKSCGSSFGICDVVLKDFCSGTSPLCNSAPSANVFYWDAFNVLTFDSYTCHNGDVEGRLAAQNRVDLSAFSLGLKTTPTDPFSAYDLVVAGDATWTSGSCLNGENTPGTIFVAGEFTAPSYLQAQRDSSVQISQLDFQNAQQYYVGMSQKIASLPITATASIVYTNGLSIVCNSINDSMYHFQVDVASFNKMDWFMTTNCNFSAAWIMDIVGSGDITIKGGAFPGIVERMIYNSPQSRNIVGSTGVTGNILAPTSSYGQTFGVTYGKLIVGNVTIANQNNKPNCLNFATVTISNVNLKEIKAGDEYVYVARLENYAVGDELCIKGGECRTIKAGYVSADGEKAVVVTAPFSADVPSGTQLTTRVQNPEASSRNEAMVTVDELPGSSSSSASVLAVSMIALLALLL